jgi:hypothetical protein
MNEEHGQGDTPRQRIERAPGRARRARLTPAPGSDPSPEAAAAAEPADATTSDRTKRRPHPDDDRITRERPPHW